MKLIEEKIECVKFHYLLYCNVSETTVLGSVATSTKTPAETIDDNHQISHINSHNKINYK